VVCLDVFAYNATNTFEILVFFKQLLPNSLNTKHIKNVPTTQQTLMNPLTQLP